MLSRGDQLIVAARGSNVLGSPLAAIAHLKSVLSRQPQAEPLQAGELVTTGTVTTARTVQAGETWWSELQGIVLPALVAEFRGLITAR